MGVTRRLRTFDDPSLQIWFIIAGFGAALIAVGVAAFLVQIAVSVRDREQLRDLTGDPWGGRTLEWATASPPPDYNFAFTPVVYGIDAWWDMKARGFQRPTSGFRPIHMPRNTGAGVILAGWSVALAVGLIWYVWWLAAASALAILVTAIAHTWNANRDHDVSVEAVRASEDRRTRELATLPEARA